MRHISHHGFVFLMEILFGLGLFGVAVIMALGMYPGAVGSIEQAKKISLGSTLARQVMEETLSKPFSAVASIAPAADTTMYYTTHNRGVEALHEFIYRVDVSNLNPELRSINVIVEWNHGANNRTVRMQCYKSPY